MELRKNYFADERKDDLHEIGQPRPRSDFARPCHRQDRLFRRPQFSRHAASEDGAQPASPCPHPHRSTRREAEKHPGVVKVLTAKDVPHNVYTILILIQIGPEDETVLADGKVRWKGEAVVAVLAETERAAQEAAAKVKVDYEVLPAVFDMEEALKPGAPLVNEYHGQNYYLYDSGAVPQGALRRCRGGLRRRRPRARAELPVLADRACADRDDRLHRRARGQ